MYGATVGFNNGALGFGNVNWPGGVGFNPMMQMHTGMGAPGWTTYPNFMGKFWIRHVQAHGTNHRAQVCQGWR